MKYFADNSDYGYNVKQADPEPVLVAHDGSQPGIPWPYPTPEMLKSPQFQAIWETIKHWDISVPEEYVGYCGATGNHVRAILDALAAPKPKP